MRSNLSRSVSCLSSASDDFASDYWATRSLCGRIDLRPRPSSVLCSQCGQALADDWEHDARVCPTHGAQVVYRAISATGAEYPADRRMEKDEPGTARVMLLAGRSIRDVVRATGHDRKTVQLWRRLMVASGELL